MIAFFNDFNNKNKIPHEVFISDNLTISKWMELQNIPILKTGKQLRSDDNKQVHNINTLCKDNRDKYYEVGRKFMNTSLKIGYN